jgi:hypothetical protein
MPSPSPGFVARLVKRLGEKRAIEYLGKWSDAILSGEPVPPIPTVPRSQRGQG